MHFSNLISHLHGEAIQSQANLFMASEHYEFLVVSFEQVDPIVQASPTKITQQYSELVVKSEHFDPAVSS